MQECYIDNMENNNKYIRKIESMGEGLLFFEVSVMEKNVGQNQHILYENGKKPPLDIAINPNNKEIEYVSYFLQDEILEQRKKELKTVGEYSRSIFCEAVKQKDTNYISYSCDFDYWMEDNTIWVIKSDNCCKTIQELHITNFDSLIFVEDEFIGFKLKNISQNEKEELRKSKCISDGNILV